MIAASTILTTVVDTSIFDGTATWNFYNTITLDIGQDSPYYTGTVGISRPGGTPIITKTGAFGGSGDVFEYIEWTISYFVPSGAYGNPISLMDDMLVQVFGFDGTDPGSPRRIGIQNVLDYITVVIDNEHIGEKTLAQGVDYIVIDSQNDYGYAQARGLTAQWFLYFMGDPTGLQWGELQANSIWPYEGDTWVTITFQTPLDSPASEGATELPLLDALAWAGGTYFTNVQNWIYGYCSPTDVTNAATVRWGVRKSGVVTGDTIRYRVEIRAEDFDPANILTDTFDPLLEYVPFSMRLYKLNAPSIYYGPYDMVASSFTDTLAESITTNQLNIDFQTMYNIDWGVDGAAYIPSPTDFATIATTDPAYESYVLEYTMKLIDTAPLGQHIVTNHVQIGGYTHYATNTIGNKIVDKSMSPNSNIASVTILINPDFKKLTTTDRYTVIDTLSDTLAMYISSLVVEAWEDDAWILQPLTHSTSGDLWTYTSADANQVSVVVPDETKIQMRYTALIKGKPGDTVDLQNSITVAGEFSDIAQAQFYINDTSGSGTGSRTTVTLIKSQANTPENLLPGAVFALYMGVAYPGWAGVVPPPGIDQIITIGSTSFYYLASGITSSGDSDRGRIVFDNSWLTPTHGAIYGIIEIAPPPGYNLPDNVYTLFSYTVPEDTQLENLGGHAVLQISDTLAITNDYAPQPTPAKVVISASKHAVDGNLTEGQFTFGLFDEGENLIAMAENT